jgi:small subunit ribosomal protein S20
MPNVKSAKKRVKTNEKRRIRNRQARATLRTALKQANVSVAPGSDVEVAKTATLQAFSLIGKTAKKGIIHRNKAARQESRLMKKLNALTASK